jgi:hypothetical protein
MMTYTTIYGGKHKEYKEMGLDDETAHNYATATAMMTAPVEFAGNYIVLSRMGRLFKGRYKNAGQAFLKYAESAAAEGTEEFLQFFPERYVDTLARHHGEDWAAIKHAWVEEASSGRFWKEAALSAAMGAMGGALLAGVGQVSGALIQRATRDSKRRETLVQIQALAANSRFAGRNLALYQKAVEKMILDHEFPTTVYLPADVINSLKQQPGEYERFLSVAKLRPAGVEELAEVGARVPVNTAALTAYGASQPQFFGMAVQTADFDLRFETPSRMRIGEKPLTVEEVSTAPAAAPGGTEGSLVTEGGPPPLPSSTALPGGPRTLRFFDQDGQMVAEAEITGQTVTRFDLLETAAGEGYERQVFRHLAKQGATTVAEAAEQTHEHLEAEGFAQQEDGSYAVDLEAYQGDTGDFDYLFQATTETKPDVLEELRAQMITQGGLTKAQADVNTQIMWAMAKAVTLPMKEELGVDMTPEQWIKQNFAQFRRATAEDRRAAEEEVRRQRAEGETKPLLQRVKDFFGLGEGSKWLKWEPETTADGKYKGAPDWVKNRKDLNRVRKLMRKLTMEGEVGRFWYEASSQAILERVNGDFASADKFIQLIAIYSPQANVDVNTGFAIRAWNQFVQGVKREDFKVKTEQQDKKARAVLYDEVPFEGRKTSSFYLNLVNWIVRTYPEAEAQMAIDDELREKMDHVVTVDMWMLRAYGYDNEGASDDKGTGMYSFVENDLRRLAANLNRGLGAKDHAWQPWQVQAAIWTAMKARYEDPAVKAATWVDSFKQGLATREKGKKDWVYSLPKTAEGIRKHRHIWRKHAMKMTSAQATANANENSADFSTFLNKYTYVVPWEAMPSESLGQDIFDAPAEVQELFTAEAMELVIDEHGIDLLAAQLGVHLGFVKSAEGAYAGHVTPNALSHLVPTRISDLEREETGAFNRDSARAYARAIQYIFMQDEVPWFRADPRALTSKKAQKDQLFYVVGPGPRLVDEKTGLIVEKPDYTVPGSKVETLAEARRIAESKGDGYEVRGGRFARAIVLEFDRKITRQDQANVLQKLSEFLGEDAGFTRTAPNEITIVNFRDDETHVPFLDDEQFISLVGQFGAKYAGELGITEAGDAWVEGERGYVHDWEKDSTGKGILDQEAATGSPVLHAWLRDRRARFKEILKRYSGKQLEAREQEAQSLRADHQALAATAGATTPPALFQSESQRYPNAPTWASQMVAVFEKQLPGKGTGKSMAQTIRSWVKKGQIKKEEVEWSGILEWLADQGKVTKDEVVAYAQANTLRVEEIIKGQGGFENSVEEEARRRFDEEFNRYNIEWSNWMYEGVRDEIERAWGDPNHRAWAALNATPKQYFEYTSEEAEAFSMFVEDAELLEWDELFSKEDLDRARGLAWDSVGDEYIEAVRDERPEDDTKFHEYQEPGGENYRELLITMPDNYRGRPGDKIQEDINRELQRPLRSPTPGRIAARNIAKNDEQKAKLNRLYDELDAFFDHYEKGVSRRNYTGGHWDEPNVLAHVRMNDRTGPNGEKILFLEEIQSDWQSDIRKKGYKLSFDEWKKEKLPDVWDAIPEADLKKRYEQYQQNAQSIPNAPWKKSYYLKAMQRMVRYAAENGYDQVAWTPGAVHYERWGSEKIAWKRQDAKPNEGKYSVEQERIGGNWFVFEDKGNVISAVGGPYVSEYAAESAKRIMSGSEGWLVQVKEQSGGHAGGIDIEAEAEARGLTADNSMLVTTKEELKDLIRTIAERERSQYSEANFEAMLDARTDKTWKRMQEEDTGISLPRKEGFESIYDKKIVNEVNKFFNKKAWGKARVGTTEIRAGEGEFDSTDLAGLEWEVWASDDGTFSIANDEGQEVGFKTEEAAQAEADKRNKKQKIEVWSLPVTDKMREKAVSEPIPLFQTGGGPRGMRTLDEKNRAIISFFEAADPSTAPHEIFHVFLEDFERRVKGGQATRQQQRDWDTIMDWLGVAPGMPLEVKHHEKWAQGCERYIAEGNAPTRALRSAFRQLKKWLLAIYESLTHAHLRVGLTDKMRRVMDRMLATEKEISANMELAGLRPYWNEENGPRLMGKAQWEEYLDALQRARDGIAKRIEDRRIREYNRVLKTWRKEAEIEARKNSDQELYDDVASRGGLNTDYLVQKFGIEITRRLRKKHSSLVKKNGKVAAEMAYQMGVTEEALIDALLEATTKKEYINQYLNQKAKDFDENVQVEELVFSPELEALNRLEAQVMAKVAQRQGYKPVPANKIKQLIRKNTGQMRVDEFVATDRDVLRAAYTAAEKASQEAARAGRIEEALQAKQRQTVIVARLRGQYKIAREVRERRRRIKRLAQVLKGKAFQERAKGSTEWSDHARHIMQAVGINIKPLNPDDMVPMMEFVRNHSDELMGDEAAFPDWVATLVSLPQRWKKKLTHLTIDELRDIDNALRWLIKKDRQVGKLLASERKAKLGEASGEIYLTTAKNVPERELLYELEQIVNEDGELETKQIPHLPARRGRLQKFLDAYGPDALIAPEYIFLEADGGVVNGVNWQYFFKPFYDAENVEYELHEKVGQAILEAFEKIPYKKRREWASREYEIPSARFNKRVTREQMIMIALNSGNEGNYKALKSWGWNDADIAWVWDELTTAEWNLVKSVWKQINSLFPKLAAVNKTLTGVPLEKVEGWEIETLNHGTIQGAYFPLRWEPQAMGRAYEYTELENIATKLSMEDSLYHPPSTKRGMTIKRNGGRLQPKLSFNVIFSHVADTIHHISHSVAVRDTYTLLKQPLVQKAYIDRLGPERYAQLENWIRFQARPEGPRLNGAERIMRGIRANTTAAILGVKVTVAMKQFGSFSQTIKAIGFKHAAKGFITTYSDIARVGEQWAEIASKSAEMRRRAKNWDREIRDAIGSMDPTRFKLPFGKHGFGKTEFNNALFTLIGIMDKAAVIPTWTGAYQKKMEESGGDEKASIEYADSIVRQTQPTASPKDMARWMRESELQKLMTPFYTFFSRFYNQMVLTRRLRRNKKLTFGRMLVDYLWLLIVPSIFNEFINSAARQELPSARQLLFAPVNMALAGVPLLRDVFSLSMYYLSTGESPFFSWAPPAFEGAATIVETPVELYESARRGDAKRAAKSLSDLAGYSVGFPSKQFNKTMDGAIGMLSGETSNPAVLLLGMPKKEKKKWD